MSDQSSTEGSRAAQTRVTGLVEQAESSMTKATITIAGYCAECGTWDSHGLICSTCGCDFSGTVAD